VRHATLSLTRGSGKENRAPLLATLRALARASRRSEEASAAFIRDPLCRCPCSLDQLPYLVWISCAFSFRGFAAWRGVHDGHVRWFWTCSRCAFSVSEHVHLWCAPFLA